MNIAWSRKKSLIGGAAFIFSCVLAGCADQPPQPISQTPPPSSSRVEVAPPQATAKPACPKDALSWPVKGQLLARFGENGAKAIKIAGTPGDVVNAAEAGRVVYAGDKISGYGLVVIVKHANGYITAYGSNQRVLVKEGDAVKRGQPIALMQSSLLFELRQDRQPVDPIPHLADCAS